MKQVWIAMLLSALVVPGAGQIYNKEKVKGFVFIALFSLVLLGFFVGISAALLSIVPPGMVLSIEEAQGYANRLMEEKGAFIQTFWFLILAIWGYGILDAFLGARARLAKDEAAPPPEEGKS
jgi:TM2 domain-containing membrane protein YozV